MAIGLVAVLAAVVLVAGGVPMRCQGPIARPPFRGCRHWVYGFLGRCRNHGFQSAAGWRSLLEDYRSDTHLVHPMRCKATTRPG